MQVNCDNPIVISMNTRIKKIEKSLTSYTHETLEDIVDSIVKHVHNYKNAYSFVCHEFSRFLDAEKKRKGLLMK